MAVLRVINVWVNPALKNIHIACIRIPLPLSTFSPFPLHLLHDQHVHKRRDVPDIEKTLVSQVDRLVVQHFTRDHSEGDEVPESPETSPGRERGEGKRVRSKGCVVDSQRFGIREEGRQ